MAISVSEPVAEVSSNVDATSYSTGAFTPATNSLLVVICWIEDTAVVPVITDSNGLIWTQRLSGSWPGAATGRYVIATAPVGIGASGTITATVTGDAGGGCEMAIFQVLGAPGIVQTGTGTGNSTSLVCTFSAALKTSGCYISSAVQLSGGSDTYTQPASWTKTAVFTHTTPNVGGGAGYRVNGETGTTVTWTSSGSREYTAIGIELTALKSNQVIWLFAKRWEGLMRDLKRGLLPAPELQRRWGTIIGGAA